MSSSSPGKNFLRAEFVWVIGLNPAYFKGVKRVEVEMSAFLPVMI